MSLQCLHGDLTSRNILLNGDYTSAKVGDLGLAKMLLASITDMNVGGTLAFAAPELLLNMRCNEKVPAAPVYLSIVAPLQPTLPTIQLGDRHTMSFNLPSWSSCLPACSLRVPCKFGHEKICWKHTEHLM